MSTIAMVREEASAMPDDVTLGELSRRFDRFERNMGEQFAGVHRQIDNLQFVSRDAFAALVDRVEQLEETKKWTVRTLAAAFLLPLIVGVIVALAVAR